MQGIACRSSEIAEEIQKFCFANNMIIETAGPNDDVVKFFCPLTISSEELATGIEIIKLAADKIDADSMKKAS